MSTRKSQWNTRWLAALSCLMLWPFLGLASRGSGSDWPQNRGPNHDGVATDLINPQWSGAVTTPLWLLPFLNSLCGFVVGGGRAFTQINRNINSAAKEGSGATRPVTGSPYPKPFLTLDPPWPAPGNQFELTVRTADGTQMDSNRLAGMEVRASTNLALSASDWPKLTNKMLLTNGVGRVLNVEGGPSRRYFIVREPQ